MTYKCPIKTPDERITYGVISMKHQSTDMYANTYDDALKMAHEMKHDKPEDKPYFIVERTEHFEICTEIV